MHVTNRPYDALRPGESVEIRRLVTADDVLAFVAASGNYNPMHLGQIDVDGEARPDQVAPGMFLGALISGVVGTQLPGPGTVLEAQSLVFHNRVCAGEEVMVRIGVLGLEAGNMVRLATSVRRLRDDLVLVSGEARVRAPTRQYDFHDVALPGLIVQRHRHFDALLAAARPLPPLRTAVVWPTEAQALAGAMRAAAETLILPILIGPSEALKQIAGEVGLDLSGIEVVAADSPPQAASIACKLVREGRVAAVMKGHLHTDTLLHPILSRSDGLVQGRRLTHVFVMDIPGRPEPLMVTDAAINIAPDLGVKVDICQNAIDLARSLGMEPRVGALSAVETVTPAIQSSVDAALLSKMAERGQITGGAVEGPLAMDNAIDLGAARTKGLSGQVAGRANILVVPSLDAGNMLVKQLAFISHAEGAGLVLGGRVPIILNSRADSVMSRLASCAVAALHEASNRHTA